MTHVVIAPSYRRFREWCDETHTNPYSGRWVSHPEDLRGYRYHQIVFLGWPESWDASRIEDAQHHIAHLQAIADQEQPVYQKPVIYDGTRTASGDQMKAARIDLLAKMHNDALDDLVTQANANGDYLDPNSIQVRVTVSARAL